MYPAWSYQAEIEEWNRQSEQGWHLMKTGLFCCKYKHNPEVRYRYQMEYSGRIEDKGRYIETFREQGWEYMDTVFPGWSYFRKPWDPAVPEDQYEVFTDRASLREMTGRWRRVAMVLAVIMAGITVWYTALLVMRPALPTLLRVVVGLLLTVYLFRGCYLMKRFGKSLGARWERRIFLAFLTAVVTGGIFCSYLEMVRPHFNCMTFSEGGAEPISAELDSAMEWVDIDIPYTDNYYLDLEIEADSPVSFSIINAAELEVYSVKGMAVNESNLRLRLDKGKYYVYLWDYAGGQELKVAFTIN